MGMGIGMDGSSAGGGGDYGYGYNETEIGFVSGGDMGLIGGYGNHGIPGGHDLGMGIGMAEMDDTMWQAQQP